MLCLPAGAAPVDSRHLADLSLEELADIRVTSVSKRSELLADAPASIFVITAEDIRRYGATSLPEALRLAPNLQVARVDARNYAITARGFNSPFENKLLVLIDGRTVYSPLFSGVYWDAQDVVLEDVDRIEVISGPGSTLWGVNAVNGVINVITRPAGDTRGGLVSLSASKDERQAAVRHGGDMANGGHYRVYGKLAQDDDTRRADGGTSLTGWRRRQAGFRSDWRSGGDDLTVHGDAYDGRLHQQGTADIAIAGANLVGSLKRRLGQDSDLSLQAYWDYTERNQPNAFFEHLHTLDLEAQHALRLGQRHNLTWGGGYRLAVDAVQNDRAFAFLPGRRNLQWSNVFAQDEIAVRPDLRLTAGLKLEHNSYTGLEVLPTLRLAYKPAEHHLLWGAASRSVRAPSRIDRDFYSPTTPLVVNGSPRFVVAGGPNFQSEVAKVLELGYRGQPLPSVLVSATVFTAHYDRLRTLERTASGFDATFGNNAEGRSTGLEAWGSWQATQAWRLSAGLVTQRITTSLKPGSTDASGATGLATNDPSNYWTLRSSYDISADKEVELSVRHSGALGMPAVPAYTSTDLRFAWRLRRDLELSALVQNLFDHDHAEFGSLPARSVFERSVFLKLVWRY
ncbi:iron complex outermembrane recepter protein [Noviherbaspirillum humi]|uniref:Iron complex outermembrane recepter protein n=1 Tax=Noviherbaspirillum humi TaxID=1688639 RepID=A0A239IDA6_9BURK|nr:TonB-dependent receptor [Noviherbaspirillum humi]SNS91509.1 iron complex outermembrane recepter protein [Noviherbaspirillum humi]